MAAPIFETKENVNAPGLTSAYGCGNTVREVILDLAKQLSGRLVVINAGRDNRREIQFPQL